MCFFRQKSHVTMSSHQFIKSHHLHAPEPKTSEFLALPQKQTARPSKVMVGRRPFPFEDGSLFQGYVLQFLVPLSLNKALLNPFFLVGEYLSSFLPDVGWIAPPISCGAKAPLLRFKSQLCARYAADDVLQVLDTDPVPWQENSKRVVLRFHGDGRDFPRPMD